MLVHICCSVDSHYFLEKIKEDYPHKELFGYFYNPNIHPQSEYELRLQDVKYSCKKLGIKLIEGQYDFKSWLTCVKGLENEPEKGQRCTVCFNDRLKKTAKLARELKIKSWTTTLLISPLKSQEKLKTIGEKLSKDFDTNFVFKDYRSGKGLEQQNLAVKQNRLYRQNYCGCIFALKAQRQQQNKLEDELTSPLKKQILPQSIEYRQKLYEKRNELENLKIPYEIIKTSFLNYRLLQGFVEVDNVKLPSYFLCYSVLNKGKCNGKIQTCVNGINYLNKDGVRLLDLNKFNAMCKTNYKNVLELLECPLSYEKELNLREKITKNNSYDLGVIVVLDEVLQENNYKIELNSVTFNDIKEEIILKENNENSH